MDKGGIVASLGAVVFYKANTSRVLYHPRLPAGRPDFSHSRKIGPLFEKKRGGVVSAPSLGWEWNQVPAFCVVSEFFFGLGLRLWLP